MHDPVNHPAHYTSDPSGVECIQITRHRNYNIGNAIKYLWRNGLKDSDAQVQDLAKAVFYIQDEIARLSDVDPNALRKSLTTTQAHLGTAAYALEYFLQVITTAQNKEHDASLDAKGRILEHRQGFMSGMEYVRELLVDELDKLVARK